MKVILHAGVHQVVNIKENRAVIEEARRRWDSKAETQGFDIFVVELAIEPDPGSAMEGSAIQSFALQFARGGLEEFAEAVRQSSFAIAGVPLTNYQKLIFALRRIWRIVKPDSRSNYNKADYIHVHSIEDMTPVIDRTRQFWDESALHSIDMFSIVIAVPDDPPAQVREVVQADLFVLRRGSIEPFANLLTYMCTS